jgi:hypothetical protein
MQGVQPRNLTNEELIRYSADELDLLGTMQVDMQKELLRRFTALHPKDEFPPKDERQQELFS